MSAKAEKIGLLVGGKGVMSAKAEKIGLLVGGEGVMSAKARKNLVTGGRKGGDERERPRKSGLEVGWLSLAHNLIKKSAIDQKPEMAVQE